MKAKLMASLVAGVMIFALVACGDDAEPEGDPGDSSSVSAPPGDSGSPDAETPPPAETTAVEVWFAGPDGLLVSIREIPATQAIGRASIEELLAGPTGPEASAGLSSAIPEGTGLLDISISNGIATVDLSREFESGGGSTSVMTRIAQVVYTLTQFPTVTGVDFRLEGEPVEVFSGEGLILEDPQRRKDWNDLLAPIVVMEPAIGTQSGSPLIVTGTANVFEATVSIELVAADGEVLAQTFTTATCGTGCRGDYRAEVAFDVSEATEATLRVFESSAEDGSPLFVVTIPVLLAP
jgi:hypothetical protein